MAEEQGTTRAKPGEALRGALTARGIDISLEDAARLSTALLSLAEQGLLVPVERPEVPSPEDAATDSQVNQRIRPDTQ